MGMRPALGSARAEKAAGDYTGSQVSEHFVVTSFYHEETHEVEVELIASNAAIDNRNFNRLEKTLHVAPSADC